MFSLQHVRHDYGGQNAVALDHWAAAQGEQWLLAGPSGSGKTTLLHLMAGLLRPSAGRITVAGQDLSALPAAALDRFRGRHIGIVFQRLHLLPALTVTDNLLLARYFARLPQDRQRVRETLAELDLADKACALPHALSQGEAQRVAIARALLNEPKVILADEPTSHLDDGRCAQVLELLLDQARRRGATLVIATHDGRLAAQVPQRLVLEARL